MGVHQLSVPIDVRTMWISPSFEVASFFVISIHAYLSNEKNPGCLVYIGGYTTQLYRDYNKPL